MATFTQLIGLQSGIQSVAQSGDTINFSGITLSNFSTDSMSDGTGTVDFDTAGALQTSGIASYDLNVTGAYTADVGSMSLDATGASNLTVTGANLDFSTVTSGTLTIQSAGDLIAVGAGASTFGDTTGSWEFDGAGAVSETGMTSLSVTPSGAITLTAGAASTWSTGAGILTLDGAGGVSIAGNAAEVDVTTTGAVDINSAAGTWDATAGLSLGASGAASDFTSTGQALTLQTLTSGTLTIDGVGLVDLNAGANLDIDVTGTFDVLATGAMSLDATGASNISVASGALTLATTTSGDIDITAAQVLDIDAASATIDTTGALDITAGAASKVSIADNTSAALDITEGANSYLSFDTSDGQEGITHSKILYAGAKDGTAFMGQMGFVAGETITAANVVALDYDTDGARVFTCQSDDAETVRQNAYGVSLAGDTAGNEIPLAISGIVSVVCTDAVAASGAEIGGFVYVDDGAKAGQVTVTAPTAGRVYKVGILVGGNGNTADTAVLVALQPQFLYDN